jgi:hypothetical protein
MKNQDFTTTVLTDQPPEAVFNAINNVRGWWSQNIEGKTDKLNSDFVYRDKYLTARMKISHFSKQKIVWDVVESHNDFFKDEKTKSEWDGTKIIFEITRKGENKTEVKFTHAGLIPQFTCFTICSNSWEFFITTSLKNLIETGKGKDISKDEDSYTTSFTVDQSPRAVYEAVNHVRGWWSEAIEGTTDKINAAFFYHYKDVHLSKMKIVELIPDERIVWFVKDNYFNFIDDKTEWKGTKIIFEISKTGQKTQLTFTHHGLLPGQECYDVCQDAWTSYIQGSLKNLITTGKGQPNTKEEKLNKELIEKWNLPDR